MGLTRRHWTFLVPIVAIVYIAFASLWTIKQNEEGVRVRFGRPVGTVGGGLHMTLPFPIERVIRVPTSEVRVVQIGVSLEAEETRPKNQGDSENEAHWLTGDTNIVQLQAKVMYTVIDPIEYLYGFAASDPGVTHEELIKAVSQAVLTRALAASTIESTLAMGKIELSRRGLVEAQELLDLFQAGIRLSAVDITEVNPPGSVISAFNEVSSAKADGERLRTEAEGILGTELPRAQANAREVVQEAHTYSNNLVSRARGEAQSFTKLATEVSKSPHSSRKRLWLESMERILGVIDERVVPQGSQIYIGR